MTFLATLQAFFQAATAYFVMRNKLAFWDVEEKVDSRLDALDKKRKALRLTGSQDSQMSADQLMEEIAEEKRKFANLKKEFNL